ncbi:O-methyltransferase [Anaerosalibacter bizertensis]|uniref:tRNA 5-hydroxyuridine methyltransferase n=1 Tax=Anaerosalibacter bizertensis TaxID=932217 RepID=A0A844FFS4_9FIRM|nr:O-methyltransferase [Anaerosalibacter bizertensis]MBV1818174.1 O-methyltransferase [Bacteroidales bacterium MSK.15.36]HHV26097.1 O-methyltransferase [Tissierellia bacterium]MBU5292776.1 O-methyltransferase [Anaerosalibacter bizertensis]MCB5558438.1 O-methyltransferase [Anaerosalibacter bizertensis]MCG4564202.1 O-methyltransferase [Anaerosalibacter bizertensis]
MVNINYDYIEKYIRSILPEGSGNLNRIKDYANKNNVPIIFPEVEQFIRVLLKISNAKNILEIGSAIGYSSLVMAESTPSNVRITTIEKRKDMYKIAKENINQSKYKDKVKIIEGDARDVIPELEEKYDFIFLDAAKGHYLEFFNDCTKKLNDEGIIVSDNVLYKGMIASDELVIRRKKTIVKRMRNYLEYISDLDGYITSVLPLGDGVSITYKEEGDK